MCRIAALCAAAATSLAAAPSRTSPQPLPEVQVIRRVLASPVVESAVTAASARTVALGTPPAADLSPQVEARHEEARGPAGASTDVVGGSLTLDLGLPSLALRQAANLRGQAGTHRARLGLFRTVCDVRHELIELSAAHASLDAVHAAHEHLQTTLSTLEQLARAGEVSGYDRDRVSLAVRAHAATLATNRSHAKVVQARIAVWLPASPPDRPQWGVQLPAMPEMPPLGDLLERVEAHPEIAALRLDVEATARELTATRRRAIPAVTLSGGARWDALPTGGDASAGYEMGAALALPGFDGSRRRTREAQAAVADADARLTRRRAELTAALRGAFERAQGLAQTAAWPDLGTVWAAATARYVAGEAPLDELLQTAATVEAAALAGIEEERLLRHAQLTVSCASGRFRAVDIQTVFEEALP